MTLGQRLAIAVLAMGSLLLLGFYFYPTHSQEPVEPPKPHKVTLNWNKAPRAISYNIYRRPYRLDLHTKLGSSATTSYEDPAVQSGERYCYAITSVDSKEQESVRSKELCVTIPHP